MAAIISTAHVLHCLLLLGTSPRAKLESPGILRVVAVEDYV